MIKKIITLFKLGRKIAKSDILNITSKFQEPPFIVKILFELSVQNSILIVNYITSIYLNPRSLV